MAQDIQQALNDQELESASDHAEDMQQLEALGRDFPPEIIDETMALDYIQLSKFDAELSKDNYLSQLQLVNPSPHGKVTVKASTKITKQISQVPKSEDLAFYHFNNINLEGINI